MLSPNYQQLISWKQGNPFPNYSMMVVMVSTKKTRDVFAINGNEYDQFIKYVVDLWGPYNDQFDPKKESELDYLQHIGVKVEEVITAELALENPV